jgi:hypothetical protein
MTSIRWFWFEAEASVSEETVEEVGAVLDAPEPVADDSSQVVDAGDGEVAEAGSGRSRTERRRESWTSNRAPTFAKAG